MAGAGIASSIKPRSTRDSTDVDPVDTTHPTDHRTAG